MAVGLAAVALATPPALAGAQEVGVQEIDPGGFEATPAVVIGPFTAADYLSIWDEAALPGVVPTDPAVLDVWVEITGDHGVDTLIRDLAVARGYVPQPTPNAPLVAVDGRHLQAPAAEAWLALKGAARAAGIDLVLVSAHRDLRDQRELFVGRLPGWSAAGIERTLRLAAPPGYSRHHSGYTIDLGQAGNERGGFGSTRAYAWLAADDFAVARAFGWIPSYPEGGTHMGPDPEPWELVWVGPGRIACAREASDDRRFCDLDGSPHAAAVTWLADAGVTVGCRPDRFCPDDPITRGEAASMLWRLHGAPEVEVAAPFDDVFASDPFAPAVDWLWAEGVTTGLTAVAFGPDRPLADDEALALLIRLAARDTAGAAWGIGAAGSPPHPGPIGDTGMFVSRAEFASALVAHARR